MTAHVLSALSIDPTDITLAFVGAMVTMMTGFYAIARIMLGQAAKDREADRSDRIEAQHLLASALDRVANTNGDIAKETAKGNREAEKRNGHLAELTIQAQNKVIAVVQTVKKQTVEEQTVEHQTVQE